MRFVRIPIDGVTHIPGENEHQFWDNPCINEGNLEETGRNYNEKQNWRIFEKNLTG